MNSATTLPPDSRTVELYDGCYPFHEAIAYAAMTAENSQPQQVNRHHIFPLLQGTAADYRVTLTQYGDDSAPLFVFDFMEPVDEFPDEQQAAVEYLRRNGRRVLASRVVEMLQDAEEDPDAPQPKLISLWDMARILAEHEDVSDPVVGPDRRGIIHGQ